MVQKTIEKVLWPLVVGAVFVSIGFLYVRYVVHHEYEILILTEEETEVFLEENSEEEDVSEEPILEETVEVEEMISEQQTETREVSLPDASSAVGEPVPETL